MAVLSWKGLLALVAGLSSVAAVSVRSRDGDKPGLPYDENTTSDCSGLATGRSYCVEAFGQPEPGITTTAAVTTTKAPTTTVVPTTTTAAGNGIETPTPVHNGIVANCNIIYLVKGGDTCAVIAQTHLIRTAEVVSWNGLNVACTNLWEDTYACVGVVGSTSTAPKPTTTFHLIVSGDRCSTASAKYGIPVANFLEWNPKAFSNCSGLKQNAYACVSVIGFTPTPTNPGNGITTPTPTQPKMVTNCDKFYFIQSGDLCSTVAMRSGISVDDFLKWNPAAGSDCAGLWAGAYACVSVIGHTPTAPGNGITTPVPTQPDIVNNCNRFHLVISGERCSTVSAQYNLPVDLFLKWNPKALSNCSGLKINSYACVNIIGYTPTTPTNPGNGVQTPSPIQDGMTKSCKTFHYVESGQTCATIQTRYKVTLANLFRWNTAIGADCRNMWANAYVCVAVL
ncbi:LysM domain-containing protein [Verticillium alfalfae VaMs.102]|uniref:LysM domain-containing protein n=1 Tax=Verticillium alfalfae (strain VaMs.102 / ATCC MYA-4576 / FGSC 10136) TaxID=526221 RepID=C9SXZ1_VERA1|nr:LysM domain-containing protein [Verticillium alfalfae VaMs.102]EEY23656.1 LysM domain-containing protein [Verticillium alfalfae VaMs.102]